MIRLADCIDCASKLEIEPQIIQAVAEIESGDDINAFLFEPHVFSRLTDHKYDESHPNISYPKWDRTRYPKTEILRQQQFDEAIQLAGDKAYRAASWGLFQIMGYHFRSLKYSSAKFMSVDLKSSIASNVSAFCKMLQVMGLVETLRAKEWSKFARVYNGPSYKLNNYDAKMENEYERIIRNGNLTA